jgi:hypothetical protein
MIKHTPGPWVVSGMDFEALSRDKMPYFDSIRSPSVPVIDTSGGVPFSDVPGKSVLFSEIFQDESFLRCDNEDLRLICAAPELLKACKAAVDHAKNCRKMAEFSDGFVISKEDFQALKSAIGKAEGKCE